MEPAPAISTCMRAAHPPVEARTHASLPPLALFIIAHAASGVSSQMITHRLRALKNGLMPMPIMEIKKFTRILPYPRAR
jgi:hypothetical protein